MKISCTPVSESGFPNSEFRMAYGGFGIPHHKVSDRGDDPETDFGMIGHGVTGWDMGCRTEFYVNSGVGHWDVRWWVTGACDIGAGQLGRQGQTGLGALGLGRRALDWQGLGRGQTGHAPW